MILFALKQRFDGWIHVGSVYCNMYHNLLIATFHVILRSWPLSCTYYFLNRKIAITASLHRKFFARCTWVQTNTEQNCVYIPKDKFIWYGDSDSLNVTHFWKNIIFIVYFIFTTLNSLHQQAKTLHTDYKIKSIVKYEHSGIERCIHGRVCVDASR